MTYKQMLRFQMVGPDALFRPIKLPDYMGPVSALVYFTVLVSQFLIKVGVYAVASIVWAVYAGIVAVIYAGYRTVKAVK